MDAFDLVVIGSGPAGEKAAALAAYFGKKVAVIEKDERLGGAPVNRGGIPTKTLRETALYLSGFSRQQVYGLGLRVTPDFALERLRTRAALVSEAMGTEVRRNLESQGIEVIRGTASLAPDNRVLVRSTAGVRKTTGEFILVATGSHPFRPAAVPFDDPDVYDSDTILDLDFIPRSLVVIGGGPVGSEYASIFAALGVEVTILDGADRILGALDREVSSVVHAAFERMGMRVVLQSPNARIERRNGVLEVRMADGEVIAPDKVLFAAGRAGNTAGLGLEEVGVELDERGRVVVDGHFRTTAPAVYAAGDVIGPPALASVSAEQGRIAACHAFQVPFDLSLDWLPPAGIYSIPEVATVGMSEEAAAEAGRDFEVGRSWYAHNARSHIVGATEGLLKLVLDRHDRRLLGVHIVGEDAAELVHIGQAVMHAEGKIDQFLHTTFNIPTRSELYKYAAYNALQNLARASTP